MRHHRIQFTELLSFIYLCPSQFLKQTSQRQRVEHEWCEIGFAKWLTKRLISSLDLCQRFSSLQMFDTPQGEYEPAQTLSSGFSFIFHENLYKNIEYNFMLRNVNSYFQPIISTIKFHRNPAQLPIQVPR